jgi:predicted thioesterase
METRKLTEGLSHTSTLTVDDTNTAIALGSGDMPVLATPAMLALMENAAMLTVKDYLEEGMTTVGGQIESSHLHPSRIGSEVIATAILERIDNKKLYFKVSAYMGDTLIGEGKHLRFIVDKNRFMSKL